MTADEHFDVIVIGAGLSGIGTACRLQMAKAARSFVVLEAREAIGGTWDQFRFPGVRSDSDMETLGYPFRPWRGEHSIVSGADILAYLQDTAREYGLDRHIRFGQRVTAAEWDSSAAEWTVRVASKAGERVLHARFLVASTGYYDYDHAHAPAFPGQDSFAGTIVHPQFWPDALDVSGRRVVVIGSGATAVTLVPALAENAAHVTMLQRSPSYVVARPRRDRAAERVRRLLPARAADAAIRAKNIAVHALGYRFARRRPDATRKAVRGHVAEQLGPGFDVDRHFQPRYQPWDQRLCLAADGDLFAALRSGRASVVTDAIERLTPTGILLASGTELAADLIVSATGLAIKVLGGVAISVDGARVDVAERLVYRGAMIEGVPNFAFSFGYATATWTLKSDLTARFVVRLLRHMARTGRSTVMPRRADAGTSRGPFVTLDAGYVRRAAALLPRTGPAPWRSASNYLMDARAMLLARLDDGVLQFGTAGRAGAESAG